MSVSIVRRHYQFVCRPESSKNVCQDCRHLQVFVGSKSRKSVSQELERTLANAQLTAERPIGSLKIARGHQQTASCCEDRNVWLDSDRTQANSQ